MVLALTSIRSRRRRPDRRPCRRTPIGCRRFVIIIRFRQNTCRGRTLLIHVENLTKRRDKRFGVLRAGECGNTVDDKERHAVESSLLSFNFLFEHLFKSFVAFDKPAEIRCRQTGFGGDLGQHFIFTDVATFREVGSEEGIR